MKRNRWKPEIPYPIQVSKWVKDFVDIEFMVVDHTRKLISCALFRRNEPGNSKIALFREKLAGDPEELAELEGISCEMVTELLAKKNGFEGRPNSCERVIDLLVDDMVWKSVKSCEINILDAIREVRAECHKRFQADGQEHYHAVHLRGKWKEDGNACKHEN